MEDRLRVLELVGEAVAGGARRVSACNLVGISVRTMQRWESQDGGGDQRGGALKRPENALSEAERTLVVAVATSPMYRDLPPSQIVPILADAGVYMASESSFYRILREEKLLAHRGRARAATRGRPSEQVATGPNQVWSWDISYLKSSNLSIEFVSDTGNQ